MFPLSIVQQAAPARGIVLMGASLPTKGNFSLPGEQRTNIEWMPGSPVAVAQILGPTEEPIALAGIFRDSKVYADDSAAILLNFPFISQSASIQTGPVGSVGGPVFLGTASQPQQRARRAIAIAEALDRMRLEGVICKLEWGHYVRYGFVGFTNPRPDMLTDIEWELEFRVTGRTLTQPKPVIKSVNLPGLLKILLAAIQKILDTIQAAIAKAQAWLRVAEITAGIDRLVAVMLELADMLKQVIGIATTPLDLLDRIRASLKSVVVAAKDVAFTAQRAVPSVQVLASASGDPVEVADATIDTNELLALIITAGSEAARRSLEIDALATSQILAVIVAQSSMSLQKIAADVYGTPTQWRAIRDFNKLSGSIVSRGTVVTVPRLS
jgi:hypothetical protein